MKPRNLLLIATVAMPFKTFALDWDEIARKPAQIEVVDMTPKPLVETKDPAGWAKVPADFTRNNATVYMPKTPKMGVSEITVTSDGYLLLACNYDYQGREDGNWKADAWDEAKFKAEGWHVIDAHEMGGDLLLGNKRGQVVFSKQVHKGDKLHLRCNKYDPPFPILLGSKLQASR